MLAPAPVSIRYCSNPAFGGTPTASSPAVMGACCRESIWSADGFTSAHLARGLSTQAAAQRTTSRRSAVLPVAVCSSLVQLALSYVRFNSMNRTVHQRTHCGSELWLTP